MELKSFKFLGHTISENGIETNDDKIARIKEAPIPGVLHNWDLELTNYYRRFIKDYSKLAAPLYSAITGNEKKLEWTLESFLILKNKLCKAPVLAFPIPGNQMIIDTDASFGEIGGVLSQRSSTGKETVIAYGSRGLSSHEKGYCVTRKELLALHEFIMYFKHYLYSKTTKLWHICRRPISQ